MVKESKHVPKSGRANALESPDNRQAITSMIERLNRRVREGLLDDDAGEELIVVSTVAIRQHRITSSQISVHQSYGTVGPELIKK